MISIIREKIIKCSGLNEFIRIDEFHPLDFYLGINANSQYSLLFISEIEPDDFYSTQIINVEYSQRIDGKWALLFSLTQEKFDEIFFNFCEDLIESTRDINENRKGLLFLIDRYRKWQQLLKRSKGQILSFEEIKGLIGEMYFLKYYLFVVIGIENSLKAWTGPELLKQDFIFENTWFEIKTITSNASSVKISSIEQLDSKKQGYLIVNRMDKTGRLDNDRISLNIIYKQILEVLETHNQKDIFESILSEFGYINRKEYDVDCFRFIGRSNYEVNSNFPSIKRESLPNDILNAKYDLSLVGLKSYEVLNSKLDEIFGENYNGTD